MRTMLSWPAVARSLPQWENFMVQTAPWGKERQLWNKTLVHFWNQEQLRRCSHHVLSTQVLHNFNLIKVKGSFKTVRCLELGRSGVRHALIVTGWRIIWVCVEHWEGQKQKVPLKRSRIDTRSNYWNVMVLANPLKVAYVHGNCTKTKNAGFLSKTPQKSWKTAHSVPSSRTLFTLLTAFSPYSSARCLAFFTDLPRNFLNWVLIKQGRAQRFKFSNNANTQFSVHVIRERLRFLFQLSSICVCQWRLRLVIIVWLCSIIPGTDSCYHASEFKRLLSGKGANTKT